MRPVERLICYPFCYRPAGRSLSLVRSRTESEGPRRLLRAREGTVDQRARERPHPRRLPVPPALPRRISEGARGRRRPPGEGHPAREGVHGLHVPREDAVRVRGGKGPGRGDGPEIAGPARGLGARPHVPEARLPAGAQGVRVRCRGGPALRLKGGAGGRPPRPRKAPPPDPDDRARVLRGGPPQRPAGPDHHRPPRGDVRHGPARPRDPPDETRGPVTPSRRTAGGRAWGAASFPVADSMIVRAVAARRYRGLSRRV